jgi:hypothetical protein
MIVNYERKTFKVEATGDTIMGSKPVEQRKKIRGKIKEKTRFFCSREAQWSQMVGKVIKMKE